MASELKVNTLTGVSTAGSIAVTAEGNSTTTNLQQGLAKVWVDYSGSGTTYNDSFNSSSATDNGTGDYTFTLTNSMGSTSYSGITDALNTDNNNFDCFMHTQAASSFSARLRVGDSGSDTDKETYGVAHGDLA
jgi:hypothetical protein|tara:strand:+ start:875 stop:1273 length:399 start_codon:yes stop_codon:yes gene_type:complete